MAGRQKRVLVTGATSGIGLEVAKQLLAQGFFVIFHGTGAGKDVFEEIKQRYPDSCDYWWFNLKEDPESNLLQYLKEKQYKLWGLVNNAGVLSDFSFWDCSYKNLKEHFEINTFSAFVISKVFMNQVESDGGRIINISSFVLRYGMGRNQSIQYAAAKSSLEALTTGLSRVGASKNVLVNAIRPGCILTRMQLERPDLEQRTNMIPLKRMGTEAEVSSLVEYFLSDRASFVTNQVITVSGGE